MIRYASSTAASIKEAAIAEVSTQKPEGPPQAKTVPAVDLSDKSAEAIMIEQVTSEPPVLSECLTTIEPPLLELTAGPPAKTRRPVRQGTKTAKANSPKPTTSIAPQQLSLET